MNAAVRYIRKLAAAETVVGLSDGQLLDRFVTRREDASLEALVRRHGPMVWGVCRRVLRDHHDAEDAFQATFLVLARKAASIRPREKVGNWLYGVAYQTARKARATRARRRVREGGAPDAPEPQAVPDAPRDELAELLDRELNRLPDKYRTPIVLCELEGKTHGEAAERLGWPVGTVSGRLSRGRALLAKRLTRRGGVLAVLLAQLQGTASAGVPAALLPSTVQAASLFAAGETATAGVVSAEVAALAGGVLKAMLFPKILKMTAAALMVFAFGAAGLWQTTTRAGAGAPVDGGFRVTVTEVIHDETTVVTLVGIDAPAGCKIELSSDAKKGGGTSFSSGPREANTRLQLTIFADQVELKGAPAVLKFMLGYKLGMITGSTSETVPLPAGAKQLEDVLAVPIKSGEYPYGRPTKLVKFNGVTYSMFVTGPK